VIHHFICISGFQQTEAKRPGTWTLAEKLRAAGFSEGGRLRVSHHRWNADWAAQAAEISNISQHYGEHARIAVFAYSWGAGYGAMQLAWQLNRRGFDVDKCVLSDPVYRHPWAIFRWLALAGGSGYSQFHWMAPPVIRLPDNVREAWVFHQCLNRPAGHRVVPADDTLLHPARLVNRVHGEMDEAPEFHACAMNAARQIITT